MADELLIKDLQGQIKAGQVVAIIGSGISIGATHQDPLASWTGLLEDGVQRCCDLLTNLPLGWKERLLAQIHSDDRDELLSAAEIVSNKLGAPKGGEFRRWLRESVGSLSPHSREVIEELEAAGVKFATTNYDGLIEKVTDLPPVTWMQGAKAERLIRGDDKGVLHLHGYWDEPESVVLGIRSYERVMGDAHAQTILNALRSMKTLLFVGFGPARAEPNFGKLLQWTGAAFAQTEYRLFRLAKENEVDTLQSEHPPEQRLYVLSFGKDDSDLGPFLRKLRTDLQPFPSLTIFEKKEFLIQNSTAISIRIPIPFKDLKAVYGRGAVANAKYWKQIHFLAERSLWNFRKMHLCLLAYRARGEADEKERASVFLEAERKNFRQFCTTVHTLPKTVRYAQPIVLVCKVYGCFDLITRSLTYQQKDTRFPDILCLIGWICDWLHECLTRSDAILKLYFGREEKDDENT